MTGDARRRYLQENRERIAAQQSRYYAAYRLTPGGQATKRREAAKLAELPAPRGGIPWEAIEDALVCRGDLTLFEMAEQLGRSYRAVAQRRYRLSRGVQ